MSHAERRMPVKQAKVELDGEFGGWWAVVRTNPPFKVWEQLQSVEAVQIKEALYELILDWNFVDEEGKKLSAKRTDTYDPIGEVPLDLLTALIVKAGEAISQPPLGTEMTS